MQYSIELFKKDKRTKTGEKLIKKMDFKKGVDKETINNALIKEGYTMDKGFSYEIYQTWVTKKSAIDGKEFVERYDTPYYCSPSSETYWSM